MCEIGYLRVSSRYGRREASRTSAAQSRSSNAGDRSRGIGQDGREDRAGSFCADPEDILLSVVAADSVGTAVGSRCCHRNDRKTKREPRTRLGVNLIFYSAARSWCAFYLHVRAGPSDVWVSSDRGTAPLRVWNRRHAMEKSDRPSSHSPPRPALHHPLLSRSPFSRIGRIHLESRTSRPGP